MNEYRYILDESSKKHNCPSCGEIRFVRFTDNLTGEYLPRQYGRCDREDGCKYFMKPGKDLPEPWTQKNKPTDPFLKLISELRKEQLGNQLNKAFTVWCNWISTLHDLKRDEDYKRYSLYMTLKLSGVYDPAFNQAFKVSLKDGREYNPATKIQKEYRTLLPFEITQYDIKQAYPSFIATELNINTSDIYSKVDKKKFLSLLNHHKEAGKTIEEIREELRPVYGDWTNEVITEERYNNKGLFFKQMTWHESENIKKFVKENEIANYVRIHDCVITRKEYKVRKLSFGRVTFEIEQQPKINLSTQGFIPVEILDKTFSGYEKNTFIQNLLSIVPYPFEVTDIEKVISLYRLGTVKNGYMTGGITFPFIDIRGNIRAIQAKTFDKENRTIGTGNIHSMLKYFYKSEKKPFPEWLVKYLNQGKYFSCLFGEHLLSKYPHNPIALVEAPKTAIYGTLYFGFPDQPKNLLWLSVFNLSGLTYSKCKVLEGRDVFLFPDLSTDGTAYDLWSNKAKDFQRRMKNTRFTVSDILEHLAPDIDRDKGKDIADYLIRHDWREYRKQEPNRRQTEPPQRPQFIIERNLPPEPKETNKTQPEAPQIEVYQLDDLANGIITPVFAGSRKEYNKYENIRSEKDLS